MVNRGCMKAGKPRTKKARPANQDFKPLKGEAGEGAYEADRRRISFFKEIKTRRVLKTKRNLEAGKHGLKTRHA